jgi:hypothetical protein
VPDRNEHLTRARQTESLASSLNANLGVVVDWAITMLFYAALHYVDAYLAGKNMHPLSHDQRDREIESNGSLSVIYNDYRRLKDLSRAARYEIANFPKEKLDIARMRLISIKKHLS